MKLGIIGLPQSGKTTIFTALTGARGEEKVKKGSRAEQRISTVRVADERVDFLTEIFKPKKTTYTQVEYLLPSEVTGLLSKSENTLLNQVRVCDALIHVARNFPLPGGIASNPEADFRSLEEEMILNDLVVVEKRLDRIGLDMKRGKKPDEEEYSLIKRGKEMLENNRPLRSKPELASAPVLKGFTFLSAKPQMLIVNNDDEDEKLPPWELQPENIEVMVVRGRLEMELTTMPPEEAAEFKAAYHIEKSALDRVIGRSYHLLNLISFFTVLNEEVKAWTITRGTSALDAAGTVHSDMKKGFIRAEVLSYEHLKEYGSFQDAKKAGVVSLEGKEYRVQDGDIIQFRFNL